MVRSARGFDGIPPFGPPICLTRTRPPAFFPMVAAGPPIGELRSVVWCRGQMIERIVVVEDGGECGGECCA